MLKPQPPTREQVAALWRDVASGVTPRETANAWAEPLMFANSSDFDREPDVMAMAAVPRLHGYDMTSRVVDGRRLVGHGPPPPGEYVRTLEQIAEEYAEWAGQCVAYDADPKGWLAERRRVYEEAFRLEVARDQRRKGQRAARRESGPTS